MDILENCYFYEKYPQEDLYYRWENESNALYDITYKQDDGSMKPYVFSMEKFSSDLDKRDIERAGKDEARVG